MNETGIIDIVSVKLCMSLLIFYLLAFIKYLNKLSLYCIVGKPMLLNQRGRQAYATESDKQVNLHC